MEMHHDLGAVLALALTLKDPGATPSISLDLGVVSATHRRDRGALGLLGVGPRELLLGVVAAVGVGDPGATESHQHRDRRSYHQRPCVYSVCVHFIISFSLSSLAPLMQP